MPSQRMTCVPGGTGTISASPSAPWRWAPWPWPPRSARKCARRRKLWRSRRLSSQRSTTSPPRPPSPPSGPPLGTWASRRKDRQPLPPAPARTSILARSWSTPPGYGAPRRVRSRHARRQGLPDHRRLDRHRRRHGPPGGGGRLPARARRALGGQAHRPRRGARRRRPRDRRALRRHASGTSNRRSSPARSRPTAGSTSPSPTPASAAPAASSRPRRRSGSRWC